jgi:hypothetical protein
MVGFSGVDDADQRLIKTAFPVRSATISLCSTEAEQLISNRRSQTQDKRKKLVWEIQGDWPRTALGR